MYYCYVCFASFLAVSVAASLNQYRSRIWSRKKEYCFIASQCEVQISTAPRNRDHLRDDSSLLLIDRYK